MKSPLHNVNRPDGRSDKSGPMLFPGYGPRILSVAVLSLSLVEGPLRLRSRPGGRHIAERFELSPRRQQFNPCRMAHPGACHVAVGPGRNRWQRNRRFRLLVLNHSVQDNSLYASFQCAGNLRYRRFTSAAANAGGHTRAALVPHLIHNRSGAGSDVLGVDLNGDGG